MRVLHKPLTRAKYVLLTLLIAFSQTALAVGPYIELQKAEAAPICAVDTAGANDEPGQKDLTKLCVDYAGVPTTVSTTWNWDELGTSGNNTMDACNLFDTDNDGNINYAVCVTTENKPAVFQSLTTYSCGDDKIDRCTSPATPISSGSTNCSVSQQNTDPFPAGDDSPKDTQGACTIQLSTVGGASAKLVDVCSYPSAQPNSDPSDCVIARNDFGKVELIKDLNPSTDTGLFNLTINGPEASDTTAVSNVGDGGTTGEVVVKNGTVVVSEAAGTNTALAGYNTTIVCRDLNGTGAIVGQGSPTDANSRELSFTLVEDADVVCIITNTKQQATLILQKTVVNDDGGTLTQADFPVAINGNTASWGSNTVSPGQYSVSETQQPGYAASVWGGDCDAQGNVTLTNDQTKTCTITNNDIAPELSVTKRVINDDGGETMSTDFNLYVNDVLLDDARKGGGDVEDNSVTYLHGGTEANVNYAITEDTEDGYTLVSIVCVDDDTQQELSLPLNLELAQKVSCTVTNTDDAPQLTIVKNVIVDNGGTAVANDFVLHLSGGAYVGTENLSTGDTPDVSANTSYTLSEDAKFGYQQTNIGCVDDDTMQAVAHPVSLSPGQSVTCTVTNNDIAPKLTVIKVVDNQEYNGELNADDFPLYVDNISVESGVQNEFNAGDYTVTETQQDGYDFVDYSGDCLSDGTINLQVGGVYTCTLTNKATPVKITVTKQVVNDNGGTAGVSDFDLYVNATEVNSGADNYFPGNVSYTISEQAQVDGYEQTSITCTNQDDVNVGANFTPANGDEIDCVIINDDKAPSLTLIKNVVNDYGQAADSNEWTLTAAPQANQVGAATTSGDGDPFDGGGVNNAVVFANVIYDLSEADGPSGYAASGWVCDGGNQDGSSLSLTLGDDVTCTITNTANAPRLIVVKQVINDNGGTLESNDFTMQVSGTDVSDTEFAGADMPGTSVTLDAGSYSVSETENIGYAESYSEDCSGEIALGETKTCIVTNDDIAGSVTFIKNVDTDGDGEIDEFGSSNWTWNLSGINQDFVSGSTQTVNSGDYTISEQQKDNYSLTDVECDNQEYNPSNDVTIFVPLNKNVTCTFTNTRDTADITVIKNVTNDDGGTADAADFVLRLNGTQLENGDASNDGATITYEQTVFTGQEYSVSEDEFAGYNLDSATCIDQNQVALTTTFSPNPNQDIVCTFENNDIAPVLTLVKQVVNDNSGEATADQWDLTAQAAGHTITMTTGDPAANAVAGKNYVLSEAGPDGYHVKTDWTCDGGSFDAETNTITLGLDEAATCTIVNDDDAHPGILLTKTGPSVVHEGEVITYTFTIENTGDEPLSNVDLNDPLPDSITYVSGDTNTNNVLDTDETWTFTADYLVPANQIDDVVNVAEVCADPREGEEVCDDDDHTVDVIHPSITVEKSGPALVYEGQEVGYSFLVTNTGDTTLYNVSIDDDIAVNETCEDQTLSPGESTTCSAIYLVPIPTVDNVVNNVDACGVDVLQLEVCAEDDHTADVIHPAINVVKDGPTKAHEGDTVNYTFTVTNTGDIELHSVSVEDNIADTASYQSGDEDEDDKLDLDETWIYTADYVIPTDQTDNVLNTVTACAYDPIQVKIDNGETVCDTDDHELDVLHPEVHVKKDGPASASVGEEVTYTFTITNIGDTPLEVTQVNDNITGDAIYQSGDENENNLLDLDETWIYTADYIIPEGQNSNVRNTVTVCAEDELGGEDCDADNHKLIVLADVVVTKFNDLNRNGEHDQDEPALEGWEMNLNSVEEDCIVYLEVYYGDNGCNDDPYAKSQLTGSDGTTTFDKLNPKQAYVLSETVQEGWNWSNTYCDYPEEYESEGRQGDDNQYYIYPGPGDTIQCYVGNYQDPVLNLTKTNNKPVADNGDTVTYTLNVSVPEASGALFSVCVTDLLPEGFAYNGNWTATSTVADHNVASDVENASENCGAPGGPNYASPGQWFIGTLLPGEVVTLTYQAVIGDSVFPGTYPDIAFAEGDACGPVAINCAEGGEVVYSNLSVADEPFVGTQVTIEGEVLAATTIRQTRLVNTGDAYTQLYLTLAGLLLLSGVIVAKVQMTKKGGVR